MIHSAKIAVVGAGGVGSCCLEYLAAAGVKELLVIDSDNVEVQNLHRQVIHSEPCDGQAPNKAVSAVQRLRQLNSSVVYETITQRILPENIAQLNQYNLDVVCDCSDNPETRQCVAEYCF